MSLRRFILLATGTLNLVWKLERAKVPYTTSQLTLPKMIPPKKPFNKKRLGMSPPVQARNTKKQQDCLLQNSRWYLSFARWHIYFPSHLSASPSACCFEGSRFSRIPPLGPFLADHLFDFLQFSFFPSIGFDLAQRCPFLVLETEKPDVKCNIPFLQQLTCLWFKAFHTSSICFSQSSFQIMLMNTRQWKIKIKLVTKTKSTQL